MKLSTILVFAMASLFIVGTLDARYKIEIKVEGALKGLNGNYFHFSKISNL